MKGHEFAYKRESCGKTRISQPHPARYEAVAKERGKGRVSQERVQKSSHIQNHELEAEKRCDEQDTQGAEENER